MKCRKLRIAWSVVWGLLAVVLFVLWVRSYTYADTVDLGNRHKVCSYQGDVLWDTLVQLVVTVMTAQPNVHNVLHLRITTEPLNRLSLYMHDSGVAIPYWILTLVALVVTPLPWLRWRFSIRTLLIATALLAVLLALIVWAAR